MRILLLNHNLHTFLSILLLQPKSGAYIRVIDRMFLFSQKEEQRIFGTFKEFKPQLVGCPSAILTIPACRRCATTFLTSGKQLLF